MQSGKTRVFRRTAGKAPDTDAGQAPANAVRQSGGQDIGSVLPPWADSESVATPARLPEGTGTAEKAASRQEGSAARTGELARSGKSTRPNGARAVDDAPISFAQLPHLVRSPAGDVLHGLMIDQYAYIGDRLILSGWVVGDGVRRPVEDNSSATKAGVCLFTQPEGESAFPALAASTRGFLAVVRPDADDTFTLFGRRLRAPRRADGGGDPERMFQDHRARLGFLLDTLQGCGASLNPLVALLQVAPTAYNLTRGVLEHAKGVPGHGGLVVGWTVQVPGVKLALVDQQGRSVPLAEAIRWHRPDIVDTLSNEFGNFTFNAGMLQGWRHPVALGEEVHLVVIDQDECRILASRQWEAAPVEPVSFAKWAFEFPAPLDRFFERLEHHDGAVIDSLVSARLAARSPRPPEILACGPQHETPRCSIIIPLFGRFDFMLNQLLEFAEDEQLKVDAELIYVVDDPRILSDVRQQAPLLFEANRVPFRIVTAGENRGFSGANNLGISVSRAPYVLLLNSDVIPVEPGWLQKLLAAIEDQSDIGIVGARLLYPNGAIQHDGMAFVWEPALSAHINKHPGMGLEPPPPRLIATPRLAVTGACLLMSRALYDQVGGLDEGFLIGDFEDSDLCLKVRAAGLSIACVEDVNLIHLERQSLAGIGQGRFRDGVVRYNAWRHEKRWGHVLRKMSGARG